MNQQEYALIVAGGKGKRLPGDLPKQFIALNGIPIIIHTLRAFVQYSQKLKMILVLPEDDFITWQNILEKHTVDIPVILQNGGETRFQSVKRGLEKIDGPGLVAIHDGVRPLVSKDIIASSFRLASVHKSAVASVKLKESIRVDDQNSTKAADRSKFHMIQTPQTFDVALIKQAYQIKEDPTLTDDASVAERAGHSIFLFEGSYDNIKITTPEDLAVAEALLNKKS